MIAKLDAESFKVEHGKLRAPEVAYLAKDQLGRSALHVPRLALRSSGTTQQAEAYRDTGTGDGAPGGAT